MMKTLVVVLALVASIYAVNVQQGEAYLSGTPDTQSTGIWGIVTFYLNSTNNLIDVFVNISGITANPNAEHGIHVHMNGDITDLSAMAALGHWRNATQVHHCENETNRHYGDMGNWQATNGNIVQWKYGLDLLALSGNNSIIGRAVVLHNLTDDCSSATATGMSGSRLAQGVIGISNVTGAGNTNVAQGRPSTAADIAICYFRPFAPFNVTGYAIMRQNNLGNVSTFVYIRGIPANSVHGIHIHQFGDIRSAASVGGHWNPTMDKHGMYGFAHHHSGDLGNVYYFAEATNTSSYFNQTFNPSFNLTGTNSIVGLALIIHELRDNCSDPVGFSGQRMAGCVWGLTDLSNTTYLVPVPTGVPEVYDAQTLIDCNNAYPAAATTGVVAATTGAVVGSITTGVVVPVATTGASAQTTTGEVSSSSFVTISFALFACLLAFF